MSKKKLLIFHPTIAPYRIDFFNSLSQAFDTRICLMYRNLKSQKFDYSKIENQFLFSPVYLKEGPKIGRRKLYFGHLRHLREFEPDIVITPEFSVFTFLIILYKWLFRMRFKIISVCDDSYNMVAENNDFSRLHKVARRILVPKQDELILVEPRVVDWYREHYGKGLFFPIIKEEDKARSRYERLLPQSKHLVEEFDLKNKTIYLFVGRLVALKNVKTAIRAFAMLNQSESVFVIIGDGPERESLETLAKEMNANVVFTGRLEGDSLYAWYNVANCFVLASYQEAFGAVTNEALLAGCWCIISNKAGSQCLIEDGKNGFTFDPMNVIELTEKMKLAVGKCQHKDYDNVKDNLMLVSYKQCLHDLVNALMHL